MNSKDFLLGGGNLPWFAVAFSIQASFLSAIFILSVPVEVLLLMVLCWYYNGVSLNVAVVSSVDVSRIAKKDFDFLIFF